MNKKREKRSGVGVSWFFKPNIRNTSSWQKEENLIAIEKELLSKFVINI
jgi:hypothetical protein